MKGDVLDFCTTGVATAGGSDWVGIAVVRRVCFHKSSLKEIKTCQPTF